MDDYIALWPHCSAKILAGLPRTRTIPGGWQVVAERSNSGWVVVLICYNVGKRFEHDYSAAVR